MSYTPKGAGADPSPLPGLIDRHKAASAALDTACARIDGIERDIAARYPAEVCRSWLRDGAPARTKWLALRQAHGLDGLERERRSLDAAEKALALELLAAPCATIGEVRTKARYIEEADIIRENLMREEIFVEALLRSLAG